jgi:hypothetical protein
LINSIAKAVRTVMALDLLKQQAEAAREFAHQLTDQGRDWKVKAETLVEQLAKDPDIWEDRVRFPAEFGGETLTSNTGMVTAFRPPPANEFFGPGGENHGCEPKGSLMCLSTYLSC